MFKKLAGVTIVLLLCLCIQRAFIQKAYAMGEVTLVSKQTQASQGLNFTLSAVRVSETAVLVHMEIPNAGKLKDIHGVTMTIGTGSPLVSAPLKTTLNEKGALVVSFQLSPDLADKCSLQLGPTLLTKPMLAHYYAVELKGYVTVGK